MNKCLSNSKNFLSQRQTLCSQSLRQAVKIHMNNGCYKGANIMHKMLFVLPAEHISKSF
jgi:hypothetical protein